MLNNKRMELINKLFAAQPVLNQVVEHHNKYTTPHCNCPAYNLRDRIAESSRYLLKSMNGDPSQKIIKGVDSQMKELNDMYVEMMKEYHGGVGVMIADGQIIGFASRLMFSGTPATPAPVEKMKTTGRYHIGQVIDCTNYRIKIVKVIPDWKVVSYEVQLECNKESVGIIAKQEWIDENKVDLTAGCYDKPSVIQNYLDGYRYFGKHSEVKMKHAMLTILDDYNINNISDIKFDKAFHPSGKTISDRKSVWVKWKNEMLK